jgi:hypothetical protein
MISVVNSGKNTEIFSSLLLKCLFVKRQGKIVTMQIKHHITKIRGPLVVKL